MRQLPPYPPFPPTHEQTGDLVVFYTAENECYNVLHRPTGVKVAVPVWELFPMDKPMPRTQKECMDRLANLAAAALVKLGKGAVLKEGTLTDEGNPLVRVL